MSAFHNNALIGSSGQQGYQISRSVRLRGSATGYFSRTAGSSTSAQKGTISFWVKRGLLSTTNTQYLFQSSQNSAPYRDNHIGFTSGDKLEVYFAYQISVGGGWNNSIYLQTSAVYRDTSAWYHIQVNWDTTQTTAANRAQVFVNGQQVTSFSTATYPTLNENLVVDTSGYTDFIGYSNGGGVFLQVTPFDGYFAEYNRIDGQALTPSSFGQFDPVTGVWGPKKYGGTYGTNGFYLNFSDNSAATAAALGKDSSGNGNNWTPNNISLTAGVTYDSMVDTPTLYADGGTGRGNYGVMNPIRTSSAILTNGNLYVAQNTTAYVSSSSTMGMSSGKWYWEVTIVSASAQVLSLGITNSQSINGLTTGIWTYHLDGTKYIGSTNSAYGSGYNTNGVVVGFAFDADAGTLTCYRNNVSQGTLVSGLSADTYYAYATLYNSGTVAFNFGQQPFTYTPPTGYKALNTFNLPDPTIKKGNAYFDATTYTGNGTSQTVANSGGFQPDLFWNKERGGINQHNVVDSVRGTGVRLRTETTGSDDSSINGLFSFTSTGFSVPTSNASLNGSGQTYVAWQWKKGATPGFDIVTYTGTGANRTVAHSLGVAPSMMIVKWRTGGTNESWCVYHSALGAGNILRLQATNAVTAVATAWNNTTPTSSNFSVGTYGDTNGNAYTFVAYLFAEVAGFSKFGSYTGNGSADGPFVYCGFRPRWILVKRATTDGAAWNIVDTSRSQYNVSNAALYPNLSNAEATANVQYDILSNGFKVRDGASGDDNQNGATYIYAAFAENPFKYSLAR